MVPGTPPIALRERLMRACIAPIASTEQVNLFPILVRFDLNHHISDIGPAFQEVVLDLPRDVEAVGDAEIGIDLDVNIHREF